MRFLRLLPLLLTIAVVYVLNTPFRALPALGRLLDPVNGAMAAAEQVKEDGNLNLHIKGLQQPVTIWMEDRMVPHVRAANDHDLYLAQGYLHAYFRLWQMDLQTRAAGGRLSEIIGEKTKDFDRGQRRKGMVYAAENTLKAVEAEPRTKAMLDAYTAGINAYIAQLDYRHYPLEYKLMSFAPEPWTNLKTALMMKYMADDLTGATDDIAYTLLRDKLGDKDFDFLFPERIKGSKPVIPEGTPFPKASLTAPPYPGDSVWAHLSAQSAVGREQKAESRGQSAKGRKQWAECNPKSEIRNPESSGIGSNNWAISGAHTASGAPILCNDPHLGLNLPSLWFEMQLTAPGVNVYGVSLPGAPCILIGFNDNISWGLTNNYRDVKDYYAITPAGKDVYLFNGRATAYAKRIETIKVKGQPDLVDTVRYTVHGPVQYDASFPDPQKTGTELAMCWMAHRATNELLALYLVNRAQNYDAYVQGLMHFECPAQNFVYADRQNNIAMWGQGQFINKWRGQGRFVMEGKDSATLWGQNIPMNENPHVLNPAQGYLASANQVTTDSTYPYWYNGSFVNWRAWRINNLLSLKNDVAPFLPANYYVQRLPVKSTAMDMMKLQNDVHSFLLFNMFYVLNIAESPDDTIESYFKHQYIGVHKDSNLGGDPWLLKWDESSGTVFQLQWNQLYKDIWSDDLPSHLYPSQERTIQLIFSDSTSHWYDDRRTPQIEGLETLAKRSYKKTADSLKKLIRLQGSLAWYKVKNTTLRHLARIPAFSYDHIKIGGWNNTINANTADHGPSWRMIVEMGKDSIRAYGVYPGGQSGNPGSPHYGDFIDYWTVGKYYALKFVAAAITKNPFKYTWTLQP